MKIGEISEREWIKKARKFVDPADLLSTDDDSFAVSVEKGVLVSNIDGFIPDSDRPPDMPWFWVGYKACVAAMSDVIAKGATPIQTIVSFTFPRNFLVEDSLQILEGISRACRDAGAKFHGGDLNVGGTVVIDVAVNGFAKDKVIPRHSAELRKGDKVYWLGPPFGSSAVALKKLLRKNHSEKELKDLIEPYFYQLKPQLDFVSIHRKRHIKASMDCSDGLALTLCSLVEGTGLGVEIDAKAVRTNAIETENFLEEVFYGGEEYGIVFISEEDIGEALTIGKLVEGKTVFDGISLDCRGWDHFKSHNKLESQ